MNRQNLAIERRNKELNKRAAKYISNIDRVKAEECRLDAPLQKSTERNEKLKCDLMELKKLL